MDLYLQFGYGMMGHCRHLIDRWHGGKVIFSPRDMNETQIATLGDDIIKLGGSVLLDPQFYNPRGNHHGLIKHDYWPNTFDTSLLLEGPPLAELMVKMEDINDLAKSEAFILPGLFCERVNDDWFAVQEAIIQEAVRLESKRPLIATVSLSEEVMRFEDQVEVIINAAEDWPVQGFYLVAEHPRGDYLVQDPMWLANYLILASGLKTLGKQVIVGYSNHQMLCMACVGVDAIASGSWLNVRSFSTNKFQEPDLDAVSRRATWYYCPNTLSEYKPAFLDMANRRGTLNNFRTPPEYNSPYADILFSGAQPSSTDYSEQQSFRHYLSVLKYQCESSTQANFNSTVQRYTEMLDQVEQLIKEAHSVGLRGQNRDFADIVDVNRAAIDTFRAAKGFALERLWV